MKRFRSWPRSLLKSLFTWTPSGFGRRRKKAASRFYTRVRWICSWTECGRARPVRLRHPFPRKPLLRLLSSLRRPIVATIPPGEKSERRAAPRKRRLPGISPTEASVPENGSRLNKAVRIVSCGFSAFIAEDDSMLRIMDVPCRTYTSRRRWKQSLHSACSR